MSFTLLTSAVSVLAIGNSLFFGFYLLTRKKNNRSNYILAFLLFALAVRISKSIIIISFREASDIFPAIGLIDMASIGPLLYLYFQSLFRRESPPFVILHFLPSGILAGVIWFSTDPIIYHYYQLVVFQMFVYLIVSGWIIFQYRAALKLESLKRQWMIRLLTGISVIWSVFLLQLVVDNYIVYFIATLVLAINLYVLGFWSMHRSRVLNLNGIQNNYDSIEIKSIAESIEDLFKNQQIHLQRDVTIDKIANMIGVKPYMVSMAINEFFHKSLPELTTQYRIQEVKDRLEQSESKHLSLEAIAFESGFTTLSAFYSSFKKLTKTTPAEFRKRYSKSA